MKKLILFIFSILLLVGVVGAWELYYDVQEYGLDRYAVYNESDFVNSSGDQFSYLLNLNRTDGNVTFNKTVYAQNIIINSLTAGSVPFIGENKELKDNNPKLNWDNANVKLTIGSGADGFLVVNNKVGIGTSTVDEKLVVAGTIKTSHNNPIFKLRETDTNKFWDIQGVSNNLEFEEDGNVRMTLEASGNVGIGTSTPTYLLDVAGQISGSMSWDNLSNYPISCPLGTHIESLGDSVTCTTTSALNLTDFDERLNTNRSKIVTFGDDVIVEGDLEVGGLSYFYGANHFYGFPIYYDGARFRDAVPLFFGTANDVEIIYNQTTQNLEIDTNRGAGGGILDIKHGVLIREDLNVTGNIIANEHLFGNLSWSNLSDYPVPCPSGSWVSKNDDSNTCTAPGVSGPFISWSGYTLDFSSSELNNTIEIVSNDTFDYKINENRTGGDVTFDKDVDIGTNLPFGSGYTPPMDRILKLNGDGTDRNYPGMIFYGSSITGGVGSIGVIDFVNKFGGSDFELARIGVTRSVGSGASGELSIYTGAGGTLTKAMFIDETQKVGLGTDTPGAKLSVHNGDIWITDSGSANYYLKILMAVSSTNSINFVGPFGATFLQYDNSNADNTHILTLGDGAGEVNVKLGVNPIDDFTISSGSQGDIFVCEGDTGNCNITGDLIVDGNITSENVFIPQDIFSHTNRTQVLEGASQWKNITFDQEEAKIKFGITHTHSDNTNTTFTFGNDGVYYAHFDIDIEDTSIADSIVDVAARLIFINGTEIDGSLFETDIIKKDSEVELSHHFLLIANAGDKIILQFIANNGNVVLSTHSTFGDHPDSATLVLKKIRNIL